MKTVLSIGLASASLAGIVASAGAQTAADSSASADAAPWTVDEIVVTARRRDESLQDVPQTVNAVTADTVEKLNLLKFEDVAAVVPGLTLANNNTGFGAAASLRGVSYESQTLTSPTVEFYLDDAPVESNLLFQSMFDVGQIEVLRGPQGTLRGRASPSGAITVTTRKADLSEFGGYAMATGTEKEARNVQGAVNVPIVPDKLAVRVAAAYDESRYDGVRSVNSNGEPKSETKAARLNVAFQPIDSVVANVSYQYMERDLTSLNQVAGSGSPGQAGGLVVVNGRPRFPYPLNPTLPANFNGPAIDSKDRLSVMDDPGEINQKTDVVTANIDWHVAGQRLSYVGGYRTYELHSLYALEAGNLIPGVEILQDPVSEQTQRTHELRLTSDERIAGSFDYTLGVFYAKTSGTAVVTQPASFLSGAFGSPLAAPQVGLLDRRYVLNTLVDRSSGTEEKSAFASLTWYVTDRTELTAGGRYIINENDEFTGLDLSSAIIALPPSAINPALVACPAGMPSTYAGTCDVTLAAQPLPAVTNSTKDKPFVYNVALSHRFTDDFMAYANVGSSWRRGVSVLGINNSPSGTPGTPTYVPPDPVIEDLRHHEPEKSRSYEIGFKSSFLEHRARVNVALYHQTFDGLLFRSIAPINFLENRGTGLQPASFQFVNSADASVDGVDVDASLQLTPNWNLSLAASYADGHVDDEVIPCNDGNLDGVPDALPPTLSQNQRVALCESDATVSASPQWTATLQSEYALPINAAMDGCVRGLYMYYPENKEQAPNFVADAYGLLNLYVGVRDPEGAWEVSLFAKNVTDTNETLTLENSLGAFQLLTLSTWFGQTGYVNTRYTPQREVGVMVRYAFGSR